MVCKLHFNKNALKKKKVAQVKSTKSKCLPEVKDAGLSWKQTQES